jgi:uncharacterized ferritin-like protein (DUF455 family)
MDELRRAALDLLRMDEPSAQAVAVRALHAREAQLWIDLDTALDEPAGVPGRPGRPRLVAPAALPPRSAHTRPGRAALLHAVAHIEANAIRLALDAVWRFAGMPADYYRDWLRVAAEEAHHFELLASHLRTLGCAYGDLDAHDGLWEMVERTRGDVVARMALVPRTLEARGLDATPPMQARLALVPLAVPARRARSGGALRPAARAPSRAAPAPAVQHRGAAACGLQRRRDAAPGARAGAGG